MSFNEERESPMFLSAGPPFSWLSFNIRVNFYPEIKLTIKGGHEFAASIHSAMEVGTATVEGNEWNLRGSRAYDGMSVVVKKQSVLLSVMEPSNAQDWYENRFVSILESLSSRYEPQMILSSSAMANGLLPIVGEGDARAFVGANLMLMHPKKLDAFPRPLHALGIRLFFPPDEDKDGNEINWGVDVKAESWIEDPSKLYLEADADWLDAMPWTPESPKILVERLKNVTDFIQHELFGFLNQNPLMGLSNDDSENQEDDEEGELNE